MPNLQNLQPEQLRSLLRVGRIPLVLAYNGITVGPGPSLVVKGVAQVMHAGPYSYWFLRSLASRSLGRDCHEVAECLLGDSSDLVKVLFPDADHSLPSILASQDFPKGFAQEMQMRIAIDGGEITKDELLKAIKVPPMRVGDYWVRLGYNGQEILTKENLPEIQSAYKLYASGAHFTDSPPWLNKRDPNTRMKLYDVPVKPFAVFTWRVSYRRSRYDGEQSTLKQLRIGGFFYRVDSDIITYSNSVAVFCGLPPNDQALDWAKLDLVPLPWDWKSVCRNGHMKISPEGQLP
jgi:hypothetical protein